MKPQGCKALQNCAFCAKPRKRWRKEHFGARPIAYCSIKCCRASEAIRGRCHSAVGHAVKRGLLPHPSTLVCADCGGKACRYDHRDYAYPLTVDAVCRSCDRQRGPGQYPKRIAPFFALTPSALSDTR